MQAYGLAHQIIVPEHTYTALSELAEKHGIDMSICMNCLFVGHDKRIDKHVSKERWSKQAAYRERTKAH